MAEEKRNSVTVSAETRFDFPAAKVWPQLCPVREYDWIENWECELVHSESGYNELGCVFRTDFPGEGGKETWMTCRFDPMERIEFVRTNATRVIHYIIDLAPDGPGTRVIWTQRVVALTEAGNGYVQRKTEAFPVQMETLEKMLGHYLATGQMLRGEYAGMDWRFANDVHGGKTG